MDNINYKKVLDQLFPLNRSITGPELLISLNILKEHVDFKISSVPSNSEVYDWIIPKEWTLIESYIETPDGKRWADSSKNKLHSISHNHPIDEHVTLDQLSSYTHILENLPSAIPYRTSYYKKNSGICLSKNELTSLIEYCRAHDFKTVRIFVNSNFKDGNLYYGDRVFKGISDQEIIITTYLCHPSMGNDNLSGVLCWLMLLDYFCKLEIKPYYSYRFAIFPETIGCITYLHQHESVIKKYTIGGFVLSCCGGPGEFSMKKSFIGDSIFDKALLASFASRHPIEKLQVFDFDIHGSDERQLSSPFFRIPTVTLSKDKYYEYEFYHTSLDDLDFVSIDNIAKSFEIYKTAIFFLENNFFIESNLNKCEPMLGKRNLYPEIGGAINQISGEEIQKISLDSLLWIMFYGDKSLSLLDISIKHSLDFSILLKQAKELINKNLITVFKQ